MSTLLFTGPGGCFPVVSWAADCCLQSSLTLFPHCLPVLLSQSHSNLGCEMAKRPRGKKAPAVHFLLPGHSALLVLTYSPGSCKLNKEFWGRACLGYGPSCDLNRCTQVLGIYTFDRHFQKQFFSFLTLMSSHIAFICITVNTCPDRKLQAGIFIYNRWHEAGAWWMGVWLLN